MERLHRSLFVYWEFVGGVLWAPRRTLERVLRGEGPGLAWFGLHMALLTALVRPTSCGQTLLVGRSEPVLAASMGIQAVAIRFAPVWIGVVVVGVTVALAARFRPALRAWASRAPDAAGLAAVPVMLLVLLGLASRWGGFEVAWLPHRSLSAWWERSVLQYAVGYGWTTWLWLFILWRCLRAASSPAPSKTQPHP